MNDSRQTLPPIKLPEPRVETHGPLMIAGLRVPLGEDSAIALPRLWQQFSLYFGHLPQQVDRQAYGLCIHKEADTWDFDYLAGCAIWDNHDLPPALSTFTLPAQDYAIFTHEGHVSQLRVTLEAIFSEWLPNCPYHQVSGDHNYLHFLEYYGENFDSATGWGGMAIWLPVAKK